jgi:NTE family protein
MNAPNADIYTIEVSFQALKDTAERQFLNQMPTSLTLPAESVDHLRAAAARIVLESPDLREVLHSAGARVVDHSQATRAQPAQK